MTITLAIIAAAVSCVALGISIWTGILNQRSAVAAEGSRHAADRAADAAKDSAESAAKVARAELDRDHEMYRPHVNGHFTREPSSSGTGSDVIFYTFTPDRSYRMSGDWMKDQASGTLSVPLVAVAGVPVRIHVDSLGKGATESSLQFLRLRFWPPVAGLDPVEPWTCRCGLPVASDGPLHWEVFVPVKTPPDMTSHVW